MNLKKKWPLWAYAAPPKKWLGNRSTCTQRKRPLFLVDGPHLAGLLNQMGQGLSPNPPYGLRTLHGPHSLAWLSYPRVPNQILEGAGLCINLHFNMLFNSLFRYFHSIFRAFSLPDGVNDKESACQWRRCKKRRFDPWVRKISWRRTWQPTPIFLPGESHG